jgi:hypothetical protein
MSHIDIGQPDLAGLRVTGDGNPPRMDPSRSTATRGLLAGIAKGWR